MPVQIKEMVVNKTNPEGASDVFLHVQTKRGGKVKGEVTTAGHTDDIDVHQWGWGVSTNTAIGSTAATARRSYKHLVITKGVDSASTGLMSALVTNDEVKEAKLSMRKAGGDALDYFVMTLSNARIVNVDIQVGADGRAVETVAFAFTKIDIEYAKQQGAGAGAGTFSFNDEVIAS
jgi:type VI secretion system secreted protein Hcp